MVIVVPCGSTKINGRRWSQPSQRVTVFSPRQHDTSNMYWFVGLLGNWFGTVKKKKVLPQEKER